MQNHHIYYSFYNFYSPPKNPAMLCSHRAKCIKCQEGEVRSGESEKKKRSWLTCISAVYAHSLILTSEYLFGPTREIHIQQLETPWTVAREPFFPQWNFSFFFPLRVLFLEVCGWDMDTTVQWINALSIVSLSWKKKKEHCVFFVQRWNCCCPGIIPPIQTQSLPACPVNGVTAWVTSAQVPFSNCLG